MYCILPMNFIKPFIVKGFEYKTIKKSKKQNSKIKSRRDHGDKHMSLVNQYFTRLFYFLWSILWKLYAIGIILIDNIK